MTDAERETLLAAIDAAGLGRHGDALLHLARPSVRLEPTTEGSDRTRSRVGGNPELPAATAWPRSRVGTVLPFVCQIELAEVAPLLPPSTLPSERVMLFFFLDPYQFEENVWDDAWGGFKRGRAPPRRPSSS